MRGLNGAQALNKAYQRGPAVAAGRRDPQPGDHRHRTARPLQTDRRHRQGDRGAERPRAAARRTDRQLQHVLPRLRRPVRAAARDRRRAAEHAAATSTAGFAALDASFPPTRDIRARHHPGRRSDARDGRGGAALDRTGARPRWRPPSSAAWPRASPKPRPRSRGCTAEQMPLYKQTEPVQQVPDERDLSRPATPSCRTGRAPRASKTTRSSGTAWWASPAIGQSFDGNGDVRASSSSATAARRCVSAPASILGTKLQGPAAARSLAAAAARHPPGLPRRRAAVSSRSCPATPRRCPNSTGRSRRARRTGAADEPRREHATKAG